MTTIISRLYDDAETAGAVRAALLARGHAPGTLDVLDSADGPPPAAAIAAAGVGWRSAQAYAAAMAAAGGGALLVVRAPFVPFGRALDAIRTADAHGPRLVPGATPDQHVPDSPDPRIFHPAIAAHARWLSRDMPPDCPRRRGLVSAAFGVPLLWTRRPPAARADRSGLARLFGPALWRRRPPPTGAGRPLLTRPR